MKTTPSKFPPPHKLGANCTRWSLAELRVFEAARLGQPEPVLPPTEERWLSVREVAQRFGTGVNTVWRWARQGVGQP